MRLHSAIYLQYKIMENIMATKKVSLQSETNTLVIIAMHFNSSLAYLWTLAEETQQVGRCFFVEMQFLSVSGWAVCVSLMVSRLGPHVINWSLIWGGTLNLVTGFCVALCNSFTYPRINWPLQLCSG